MAFTYDIYHWDNAAFGLRFGRLLGQSHQRLHGTWGRSGSCTRDRIVPISYSGLLTGRGPRATPGKCLKYLDGFLIQHGLLCTL